MIRPALTSAPGWDSRNGILLDDTLGHLLWEAAETMEELEKRLTPSALANDPWVSDILETADRIKQAREKARNV